MTERLAGKLRVDWTENARFPQQQAACNEVGAAKMNECEGKGREEKGECWLEC